MAHLKIIFIAIYTIIRVLHSALLAQLFNMVQLETRLTNYYPSEMLVVGYGARTRLLYVTTTHFERLGTSEIEKRNINGL